MESSYLPMVWIGFAGLVTTGCATAPVGTDQLDEMRSEMQSMRARQEHQEKEISELKSQLAAPAPRPVAAPLASPSSGAAPADPASGPSSSSAWQYVPDHLRVVRLAPEPLEFSDAPDGPAERGPAARVLPVRHRPPPSSASGSLETPLKEPLFDGDTGAAADQPPPASPAADAEYQAALASPDAVTRLEVFSRLHPSDSRADNALFEAGVRAERTGGAERAAHDFELLVREHPAGDVVADALLHLAACDLELRRDGSAREVLRKLTLDFPGTAQAQAAQARLMDLAGETR